MRTIPRFVALLALVPSPGATAGASISLLDGADIAAWNLTTEASGDIASVCSPIEGSAIAVTGTPAGYFSTRTIHADYRLHLEWRWTGKPGNGGVLLHIATGPKDRIWPQCFQVQLKNQRAGDVIPMAGAACAEFPDPAAKQVAMHAPPSEKPPGEWNACDIVCRGDTIECAINGVPQNRVTGCAPARGTIGFQLEGAPFELRNVVLVPLEP